MCQGRGVIRNEDFTTGFYEASQLTTQNQQNYVSSPASVLVLLSLLFGARGPQGATRTEICEAITGQSRDCEDRMSMKIVKQLKEIVGTVSESKDKSGKQVAKISNAVFVADKFSINKSFREEFSQGGVNEIENTDFTTGQAVKDINNWVNAATDGMIEQLYSSSDELSTDTLVVLLNTVYFKCPFKSRFSTGLTKREDFVTPSKTINVNMMSKLSKMKYYKNEAAGYHMIGLELEAPGFMFVVILPLVKHNLAAVNIAMKTKFDWTAIEGDENEHMVQLSLPRFKLEHNMNLKEPLQKMGIKSLFDRRKCDLSGVAETPLFVNKAKQKTVLEVNEYGVRAAAASTLEMLPKSMIYPDYTLKVNEPFFCGIYSSDLKMPIFIARVVEPEMV